MDFFSGINEEIKEKKPDPLIISEEKAVTHIDTAKGLILHVLDDCTALEAKAEEMVVTNEDESKTAMEMILQSRRILNALEAQRKKILKQYADFQKEINGFSKKYQTILQEIFSNLSGKRNDYEKKLEQERIDAESKRLAEEKRLLEEQQEKARKAMEEGKLPEPIVAITAVIEPLPPEPKLKETCEDGIAVKKTSWKWEIVDINEIPREFLVLDEVKINEQIKAGVRSISGIKIFEQTETTYRAKSIRRS